MRAGRARLHARVHVHLVRQAVRLAPVARCAGRHDVVPAGAAALHERVEEVAVNVDERLGTAEARLDGAIAYRALVRYDAYGELSGRQSSSLALLDAAGDGVVLSCITHRDTARLYTKAVHAGHGEHELSPEEDEAIRLALAGETQSATLD